MTEAVVLGIVSSLAATVVVLVVQSLYRRLSRRLPAQALFKDILGEGCLVVMSRMTDTGQTGKYLVPLPKHKVIGKQAPYSNRCNVPWVTSAPTTTAVAQVLNALGRAGKSSGIRIGFEDEVSEEWSIPLFVIGGGWMATRAFDTLPVCFKFRRENNEERFVNSATGESYKPETPDQDIGLLEKTVNPGTCLPVWIAMGWRGNGTLAAALSLSRWWWELGLLYGTNEFGILVRMDDQDGPEKFEILALHPPPCLWRRWVFWWAWSRLRRAMVR